MRDVITNYIVRSLLSRPRIALFDVDSKIPNLALMRLSSFYKSIGYDVEWYDPTHIYERVYASKIFKFSNEPIIKHPSVIRGGTGWSSSIKLPQVIENMIPDYSIYNYSDNIGFTMRGCRFRCKFCVVPEKEGKVYSNNTITDIWTQRKSDFVMLLDNDFFGNPQWSERIAEIRKYNLRVSFSQGLNIRIITEEQAKALASVRFRTMTGNRKMVHFAWDQWGKGTEKLIDEGFDRVVSHGIKPYMMTFFVLIGWHTTEEQDLYRINKLHNKGAHVFVMPYNKKDPYQKALARWNNAHLWRKIKWVDYQTATWTHPDAIT